MFRIEPTDVRDLCNTAWASDLASPNEHDVAPD